MNICDYRKIMVVGNSGSGKSYFAKKLASITNYSLTHLDNIYWQPDWVKLPRSQWIEKQKEMIAQDSWILDGNYDSTMELRYDAADLIVFLDRNRLGCMYRAFRRHGKKRSDLPEYLEEKVDLEFFGFLKLIWTFQTTGRVKILSLRNTYPNKKLITLKNKRAVNRFFQSL